MTDRPFPPPTDIVPGDGDPHGLAATLIAFCGFVLDELERPLDQGVVKSVLMMGALGWRSAGMSRAQREEMVREIARDVDALHARDLQGHLNRKRKEYSKDRRTMGGLRLEVVDGVIRLWVYPD